MMRKRITISIAVTLSVIIAVGPLASMAAGQRPLAPANPSAATNFARSTGSRPAARAFSSRLLNKRPNQDQTSTGSIPGQSITVLPGGGLLKIGGLEQSGPVASIIIEDNTGAQHSALGARHLLRARAFHSATMLPDGTVLIVGGIGANGEVVDAAEIFNPETLTCDLLDSSPRQSSILNPRSSIVPRVYHTATLLTEGLVLIAGGLAENGDATRTADLWDYKSKQVVKRLKLRVSRYGHIARLLSDGRVLISGGSDNHGKHLATGEVFDSTRLRFSSISAQEEEAILNSQSSILSPELSASIPGDGANSVALDAVLALRFSHPLSVSSVNSQTVTLSGPYGAVETKVVPAEAGMLAFVTPKAPLLQEASYTLAVNGAVDRENKAAAPVTITFTTSHVQPALRESSDGEEWIPGENDLRNGWRTNRADSDWRSLPPLQAAPGVTALAGQALTLNGKPLANVTMKIASETARTDETGRFLIENVEPGRRVLVMDGRSASKRGKTYGVFEAGVDVREGKTTALAFTVWMPVLDTAHEVRIPSPTTSETIISTPLIPDFEVRIPAGAVIRDIDGKRVKKIGVTPLPLDRPPFPLPKDVYVPIYFTVQPGGAYVELAGSSESSGSVGASGSSYTKGARLIYPNYRREGSGTRFDFWHYDPEEKDWYVYGKGTVREDQRQIVPDPGVSVQEFTGAMVALPSTAPATGPAACNCAVDGDPVDLGTGLFVLRQDDLVLPDIIPISVTRTYRPQDTITRSFGIGATHAFEIFLIGDTRPWTYMELVLPGGARIHYNRISPARTTPTPFMSTHQLRPPSTSRELPGTLRSDGVSR